MGFTDWLKQAANTWTQDVEPFFGGQGPSMPVSQYRDPKIAAQNNAPTAPPPSGNIDPGMEQALSSLNWFRQKAVSQPLATALLVASKGSENQYSNNPGFFFNSKNWSDAWTAAQHISPGQAVLLNPDRNEASQAEASGLMYYKPADSMLPAGFNSLPVDQQQSMLKGAGMPAVGNQYVDMRQDSTTYKYASGGLDFLASWELDPTVLLGKGVGRFRSVDVAAAGPTAALKNIFTGKGLEVAPLVRPKPGAIQAVINRNTGFNTNGGWSKVNIDQLINSSPLRQAQEFMWRNKDNPQLLNQLPLATKTALGPRFGAIVSTLQTPEEVNLFLRVGMGDVAARSQLETTNAAAALAMEQDTNRLAALDLQASTNAANPYALNLINARMAQVQAGLNANTTLVQRYNGVLDHAGEIDNVRIGTQQFARAIRNQTVQNSYTAGAARRAAIVSTGAPLSASLIKQRFVTNFFSTPVTMVRSFSNFKPHGYMALDDVTQDSVNELRGFLARIPNIDAATRENAVNRFLQAPDAGSRLSTLEQLSSLALGKIAVKHGLTPEFGGELYDQAKQRLGVETEKLRQYATATADVAGEPRPIRVDAFHTQGGALHIAPNLVTRLLNDHILPDLDEYDRVLGRHSSALKALTVHGGNAKDAVVAGGEFLNQLWKFGTLARLGYIPRVLGDDLGGQMARLGMASMALRAGYGVKNLATNMASMLTHPFLQAGATARRVGADYATSELRQLEPQIAAVREKVAAEQPGLQVAHIRAAGRLEAAQQKLDAMQADPTVPPARLRAMQTLVAKHQGAEQAASAASLSGQGTTHGSALADLLEHQEFLTNSRDQALAEADAMATRAKKTIQGSEQLTVSGIPLPGAFQGTRGQYFQQVVSGDQSLANVFNTNKQLIAGNMMRSYQHGAVQVSPLANPDLHLQAWSHILTAQMGQDVAARRALADVAAGATVDESAAALVKWFKTPGGLAYRKQLGLKFTTDEEVANSIAHDVHEMAPSPDIANGALSAEGVTPDFLRKAVPNPAARPDAISPAVGANYTLLRYHRVTDRVIQHWFNAVATIPANRWSRHPLFNQLYEGHAQALIGQEIKQRGGLAMSLDSTLADKVAETARRLALKDTRNLVFDIAHQSDAMAALRMVSPFFSASLEGWQRWARIILDKPQTVGYASKFFNAPLSQGWVQDQDGNTVTPDGMAYDPVQKKMVPVPMANRRIVARVPWGLANGVLSPLGTILGADGKGNINLSQNSMNLVLNGDPWFNPGEGPLVTIPLEEYVKDKPSDSLLARQLGVLPFGVSTASGGVIGRVADETLPRTVKDFLSAFNTSDSRYQQVKLQITQDAYYRHANEGAPMPTAAQISKQVRDYWLFSAASAFMGPVAGQKPDPYAFYRDQYNNLRRTDPSTADTQFLDKYGESLFVFAQSMSKNASGVGATVKAANLEKQFGAQIAANPELAALIIGPEGNGPFSPEAYNYELNTPLIPGGTEMMRTHMSASDAMADNQRRLGWAKYTAVMNGLTAQLYQGGFKTFRDSGAEALDAQRKAYVALYSNPITPDGKANPYYNDAWSRDYSSYDSLKYERLVPGLTSVANSPLAQQANRSDLKVLQQYLQQRANLTIALAARKAAGGSNDLKAASGANDNSDLLQQWIQTVQQLVESDVNFGNLYHRYLSRDLGVDAAPEVAPTTDQTQVS
jgi:hypothetical protein